MVKQNQHDGDEDGRDDPEPEAVSAAALELYSVDPDGFLDRRAELAAQARDRGDADTAKRIGKLRKPTVAAWIVNRQVHDDDTIVPRILELYDRLRAAHEDLDAESLRSLSAERRELVDELAWLALRAAGRTDPAAQLRDEVRSTFDAAVADPSIALGLGRLQRFQSWSGFGVAPAAGPALTVVRGGEAAKPKQPPSNKATARESPSKSVASKAAKPSRALVAARKALSAAESEAESAGAEERRCAERVESLTAKLSELESDLVRARTTLDKARTAAKAARTRRREAQAALNRAERAPNG